MSRRIVQTIKPTRADVDTLRSVLTNRGANDPNVKVIRRILKASVPTFKLDDTHELTDAQLEEIQRCLTIHRQVADAILPIAEAILPEGDITCEQILAALGPAEHVTAEMHTELAGVATSSGISA